MILICRYSGHILPNEGNKHRQYNHVESYLYNVGNIHGLIEMKVKDHINEPDKETEGKKQSCH